MTTLYSIQLTPQAFDYIRTTLGARPFDEVFELVMSLARQRHEQDNPPAPAAAVAAEPAKVEKGPRAKPGPKPKTNGKAAPEGAAAAVNERLAG